MPYKVWVAGEEVLSADFQPYVQEQVVATFPTAAARTAALAAPKPGMVSWLADVKQLQVWDGISWVLVPAGGGSARVKSAGVAMEPTLLVAGSNTVLDFGTVNYARTILAWFTFSVGFTSPQVTVNYELQDNVAGTSIAAAGGQQVLVPAGAGTFTAGGAVIGQKAFAAGVQASIRARVVSTIQQNGILRGNVVAQELPG